MTLEYTAHTYPPGDPELVEDPYGGSPVWLVTRHDDVSEVLSDPRLAMGPAPPPGGMDVHTEMLVKLGVAEHLAPYLAGNLVHTDPPDHTRLRKLLTRAFSARRIAALRPRVETVTEELLRALPEAVDAGGAVDMVEHFAFPLPITVICELLGVPAQDRPLWRRWSVDCGSMDPRRMNPMLTDISSYILELAEQRRAEPADDLLTALVQARDEESGRLSDTELIAMVLNLVIAGHETTAHLISNGLAALLTHPEQLALLRDDPALVPGAVQELIRWCGPAVTAMLRYAREDTTVGGACIRRGERVQAVLGTANRDPARFADPDTLDIRRTAGEGRAPQHVGYSHGMHYCLGASLANQEAEVAFTALLARCPGLALAVSPQELKWKPLPFTRVLTRLPVRLGVPRP
ncbi:cytochrome P450 family protein [Streptomyces smyrnaeus]|uniref:cytochrome P450 family protein n=1 Tax=Streptomyces smyrnaeus TaxID=1387713 RepID=UPI0033FA0870